MISLLYDFYHKLKLDNFNIFILSDNDNINNILNNVFKDNLINISEIIDKYYNMINNLSIIPIIQIKKLILIQNSPGMSTFLSFPKSFNLKLNNHYLNENIKSYDNIFIDRSFSNHISEFTKIQYRKLQNFEDLRDFFSKNNFNIINPESIDMHIFINYIKNAKNIITTAGSALCNLLFYSYDTRIFCLRSSDYLPAWRKFCNNEKDVINKFKDEDFEKKIFENVVKKFDFHYIDSFNNIITDKQLKYIIDNIKK
jgi:hypothetical protein